MEFLPRTMGTRPRLACEVRAEGVVAARADDAAAVLQAVARAPLANGVDMPQIHVSEAAGGVSPANGNAASHSAIVAAVRKALEEVSQRSPEVTLVVPDSSARVLLLDFDALPAKVAEALPVVRFRLKKLLPFDADDAAVSYQVMAASKGGLQVLAVAMPGEVLAEYESVVREAGFEPGAVLPSTLAALAGLGDGELPTLLVNAGRDGVTTAIVKAGVLLLHRTVDLSADHGAARAGSALIGAPVEKPADTSFGAIAARMTAADATPVREADAVGEGNGAATANEVAQAVSVAAAYFEDTLETAPTVVLAAGTLGAAALTEMIGEAHVGPVAVREMLSRQMLGDGAASADIPLGWLAGVRGALAN